MKGERRITEKCNHRASLSKPKNAEILSNNWGAP
jgi:hypothetical protein